MFGGGKKLSLLIAHEQSHTIYENLLVFNITFTKKDNYKNHSCEMKNTCFLFSMKNVVLIQYNTYLSKKKKRKKKRRKMKEGFPN